MSQETIAKISESLTDIDGALVAFSGGVDSSVVAALAHDALGDDAIACTAKSETLPETELEETRRVADEIWIRHEIVSFSELDSGAFKRNDEERCYHCRTMRLSAMFDAARDHIADIGFDHVTLDLHGYRTGSVSPADEEDVTEDATLTDGGSDELVVENVFDADYPSAPDRSQ